MPYLRPGTVRLLYAINVPYSYAAAAGFAARAPVVVSHPPVGKQRGRIPKQNELTVAVTGNVGPG